MDMLIEDDFMPVINNLDDETLSNLILVCENAQIIISNSQLRLQNFTLKVVPTNFRDFFGSPSFYIPLRNLSISYDSTMNFVDIANFVSRFQYDLEHLELNNFKFNNIVEFSIILSNLNALKSLRLNDCHICAINNETLAPIRSLKSLTFNKCSDNVFKIFTNQETLEKITVGNDQWTWNGFPHDILNQICRNSKNLNHLVLDGAGTGSYFDCDDFPYKITKLETTMISFNWYVGIRTQRNAFLKSQQGSLKDLTIHQLPYDFDGGKVLKYIIEEMDLNNFNYGNIPLIVNKVKQDVPGFTASEIQITSAVEMIKQFLCLKFTLIISGTDIASDEIEKKVNPPSNLFKNVKEFEVVDNSEYRGIFGVFLGLMKNLNNIQKLTLRTMDRNINTIIECLPKIDKLEDIYVTSEAPRVAERLRALRQCSPNLKKLSLPEKYLNEANAEFKGLNVEIIGI
ncbi:uncharacterized protein [Chironomus tepperi]|uniref:uncharacterized protein n=1 Tax=Chironomus tepperi TaxID=113505 RepID=UPI00391F7304